MIVKFSQNEEIKDPNFMHLSKDAKYLVLEINNNFKSKLIEYQILLHKGGTYNDVIPVGCEQFQVVCDLLPSSWVFEYEKNEQCYYSSMTPRKWVHKKWTYGFWEALYCGGDTGYEKLSSKEEERAKQVFLEEAKKIYEECGKGWVPNPFE